MPPTRGVNRNHKSSRDVLVVSERTLWFAVTLPLLAPTG